MATSATKAASKEVGAQRLPKLDAVASERLRLDRVALALVDISIVFLSMAALYVMRVLGAIGRMEAGAAAESHRSLLVAAAPENAKVALAFAVILVLACDAQHLYEDFLSRSFADELVAVTKSVLISALLASAVVFLAKIEMISRLVLGISTILILVGLVAWRAFRRRLARSRVKKGLTCRNVLIVGTGPIAKSLAAHLERRWELGYRVKGFISEVDEMHGEAAGTLDELPKLARAQFVDEVFVTVPTNRDRLTSLAMQARTGHFDIKVIPEMYELLGMQPRFEYLGDFPIMSFASSVEATLSLAIKRMFDIFGATMALTVAFPVLVLAAIATRLETPGPIFYRSRRVGWKGNEFTCLKLRTMVKDAEQLRKNFEHLNERDGILFKISRDPRITRVGRLLRKYSIDEIPQFWNVLKGEMSLVGPRPALPQEVKQYQLDHLRRLDVRPGITGLWQVTGRTDPSFESYVSLDLEYIENWSLATDFRILLRTVEVVLQGTGS